MISKPSRHCTVELQALPSRIGQVRRIVSAQLRYWHLDPLIDSAALGVTELLTNVHRHAEPDKQCRVEIALFTDRLTVSVRDSDPRVPSLRGADLAATCGRGLALVASFSESWGVRPHDDGGKAVWFTLHAPAAAVPASAAGPPTPGTSFAPYPLCTPAPAAAHGVPAGPAPMTAEWPDRNGPRSAVAW
ncbi:ATP-binding protein [Streptomyces sp. NPDC004647]|uniref:ATP-binding protein n=1 Tax=Streptomyces sp. NPDC004647 TaxID=3154671 RepID=UPI0033A69950